MTDALSAGSIAFTGYTHSVDDSTTSDTFHFAALTDISAGTVINFTKDNWNGGGFSTSEGTWTWTATSDIAAGTVVTLDNLTPAYGQPLTPTSNLGTVTYQGAANPEFSAETLYAYVGSASSPTFVTAFSTWQYYSNQSVLDGTGLTAGINAINVSPTAAAAVIAAYHGPTSGFASFDDYRAALANLGNWDAQNYNQGAPYHDGATPDAPLSTTPFTIDPSVQTVGFADQSIVTSTVEGGAGQTSTLSFTVVRSGATAGDLSFSGSLIIPPGSGIDAADFGGTLPTFAGVIPDGQNSVVVTINVAGDIKSEADEIFQIKLDSTSNPQSQTNVGGAGTATATIVNDDAPQSVAFAADSRSVTVTEGDNGTKVLTFKVERSGGGNLGDLNFAVQFVPNNANVNADDFGGTLPDLIHGTIADGQDFATISVTISGDTRYEASDFFQLVLTSVENAPVGAVIDSSGASAFVTIANDDPMPNALPPGGLAEGRITMSGANLYSIGKGAVLSDLSESPLLWTGANSYAVLNNDGTIEAGSASLTVDGSAQGTLVVNNSQSGAIYGPIDLNGQRAGATVNIINSGLMDGVLTYALRISNQGNFLLNNLAGGVITNENASSDVIKNGGNAVINNMGQIVSVADSDDGFGNLATGGDAIDLGAGTNDVVHNYNGGIIIGSHHALTSKKGVTVVNDAGGVMLGRNGSAVNVDNNAAVENTVYVTNRGTLTGASANYSDSDGDAIDTDGLLKLDNYGLIQGIGANGYHNGEANVSEGIAAGGGVINNFAGGTIYGYGRAIQVDDSSNGPALGATTIYNEGLIRGDGHGPTGVSDEDAAEMNARILGGEAINILGSYADSITNTATGQIIGGIKTDGGNDTLTNAGIITATAGSAVNLGDGDDTLNNSGKITGTVLLGAGDDTVNIYAGSTSGTIDGGDGNDTIHAYAAPGSSTVGTVGASVNVEKLDIASGSWVLGYGFDGANIEVESGATITSGSAATAMGLTGGQTLTVDQGGTVVGTKFAIGISGGNTDAIVINSGTIKVTSTPGTKADAITLNGGTATIHNTATGTIEGARHAITGPIGIHVVNDAGGVIVGRNGSAVNMDNSPIVAYTAYVDNYGTMLGQSANISDSDGDAVDVDGFAVINNYGNIRGEGANGYHKGEANVSEGIAIGGGTINNYAGGNIYGYGRAIEVDDSGNGAAFSSTIINNAGLIEGGGHGPTGVADADVALFAGRLKGGEAINIIGNYADTITNSGRILGGVKTDGGGDSLTNSGLMVATGGSAVDLGTGNDSFTNSGIVSGNVLLGAGDDTINLVTGSTVSGTIDGGDGNDTLNLTGTGSGALGKGTGIEKVDVKSGAWAIDSDASYGNVTVEGGASLVVRGAVTSGTVEQGAGQFVYGHADHTIVLGEQAIHAGGVATATTIGAGGVQNLVEGATANGTTIEGGTQDVYGSADDTTIDAAGLQNVHGRATDTVVNGGGEQNVYQAATAIGTTLNSGGIQIDWGTAVATTIDGGSQYVYGTATDTVILSGTQHIGTGGATYGTMIGSGGTVHAYVGASVHNATFAGSDATLVLDHASDFSGFISGWQDGNHLDLSDIQFGQGTTLAYVANGGNTGGKLTVSDGAHTVSLALLGQYTAADFAISSDGHGGTVITDPGAGVQQSALALPHAA